MAEKIYDFIVVGSGFGGSVSAMRLAEKGYEVLVLERGRRFEDKDFPKTNWNIFKFLWKPAIRSFGIQEISFMNDVMVLHGSGVGGGSLVYANVLMEPSDKLFETAEWSDLQDWKTVLRPYYDIAKRMLGVTTNPYLTPADMVLKEIAEELGQGHTFRPTNVAVFFGEPHEAGKTVPDPYFNGEGPERAGCIQCGGCMIGCRHNAKNILLKNYLYFAEKWGTEIRAESEVINIRPLSDHEADGARYEVIYRRSTAFPLNWVNHRVRTRNVVVSAHAMGTMKLLFHCRDVHKTLPNISQRLGDKVRTNSETIPGSTSRNKAVDYSTGVAITSILKVDEITHVEPVRYPRGSGFIRLLAIPIVGGQGGFLKRLWKIFRQGILNPLDFIYAKFIGKWARNTTILLFMQTEDNTMKVHLGRNLFTGFRKGLVSRLKPGQRISPPFEISHGLTQRFAEKTNGVPQDSIPEALLGIPTTAHLLGGVPMGRTVEDGVVNKHCEVFNYPGLYVIDGSVMPANPGINPSLSIAAIAEYAMSNIPAKADALPQIPLVVTHQLPEDNETFLAPVEEAFPENAPIPVR